MGGAVWLKSLRVCHGYQGGEGCQTLETGGHHVSKHLETGSTGSPTSAPVMLLEKRVSRSAFHGVATMHPRAGC